MGAVRAYVRPLLQTYGPPALMTFAIGLANQINALGKHFGNRGFCLTGMSSRGVVVVKCTLSLIGGGYADQFVNSCSC
jgi:hypothetical protein